jgi:hypothetical protein
MSLNEILADYREATVHFLEAVEAITADNIDRHVTDGWSARQIVHHVADSETQSYARLRRLLAEPEGSIIQGYDEGAWAECATLGYRELPIAHSLSVFTAVRQASSDVLARVSDADFERTAHHSESGPYTLATWVEVYTRHPREHAAQLVEAINA